MALLLMICPLFKVASRSGIGGREARFIGFFCSVPSHGPTLRCISSRLGGTMRQEVTMCRMFWVVRAAITTRISMQLPRR